jgi:lysine/ornithine N-monooxygenase
MDTLGRLYEILYEIDYLSGSSLSYQIFNAASVVELSECGESVVGQIEGNGRSVGAKFQCDFVVCATGYVRRMPKFLEGLEGFVVDAMNHPTGEEVVLRAEFDEHPAGRIFIHGEQLEMGGVGDQTLALTAWRSARIVNALEARDVISVEPEHPVVRHFGF